MGDKIGDYIHWKYDNYLTYGTNAPDGIPHIPNPEGVMQAQRAKVKAEIMKNRTKDQKNTIKEKLLENLNFLYANGPTSINGVEYNAAEIQSIQQRVINIIQSNLGSNAKFDFDFMVALDTSRLNILTTDLQNLGKGNKNWLSAIYERLRFMIEERNKLSNIQKANSNIQDWSNRLDQAVKDFNNIVKSISLDASLLLEMSGNNLTRTDFLSLLNKDKKIIGAKTLAGSVNTLLNEAKRAANVSLSGKAAEWFSALGVLLGSQYGKQQVFDILTDFENGVLKFEDIGVVGNESSMAVKITDNFSTKGMNKKQRQTLGSYFLDFGSSKIKAAPTQDKVDLMINLSEADGGEKIGASIKNYDLSNKARNIHILSGSDLLNYVQEYRDFVNHYLNLTVENPSQPETKRNIMGIRMANDVMALTIAVKALIGNVWKQNKNGDIAKSSAAELFIVHDNSQVMGGYNIYFMEDIISNLELMVNRIFEFVEIEGFDAGKTWKMGWIISPSKNVLNRQSAYQRILHILNSLSEFKLEVSISQNALI